MLVNSVLRLHSSRMGFLLAPDPLVLWVSLFIGRPLSSVCCPSSTIFNISSETNGPMEAKFHVEPAWDGGTRVCSNGPCHVTKMAAKPLHDKTL